METVTVHPGASADPMASVLADVLLKIHNQTRFAGVLAAVAAAGPRLGASCYVACLLRDPGTDGWHLTAMIDSAGRPGPLERLGVPAGPFPTAPVIADTPRPLAR